MGRKKMKPGSIAVKRINKFFPKVTSVVDATEGIEVEVGPKDVAASQKRSHAGCAMAVACKRKTHADGVLISRAIAYIIKGKQATRYSVPGTVAREVVSFDRGASFEPGLYRLAKPEPMHVGGHNRDTRNEGTSSRDKETSPRHFTANIRTTLGGRGSKRD